MTLEEYIVTNTKTLTNKVYLSVNPNVTDNIYVIYHPLLIEFNDFLNQEDNCQSGMFILDIYGNTLNDVLILSTKLRELFDNGYQSTLIRQIDLSEYTNDKDNSIGYRINQQYNFNIKG